MNRDRARQEIRASWRRIITDYTGTAKKRIAGNETYICPFCGHGTNGDGMTGNPKSPDGNAIKCFGCGFSGDIIDFIQQVKNTDYSTALKEAAACIGIEIDPYKPDAAADFNDYDIKNLELEPLKENQAPHKGTQGDSTTQAPAGKETPAEATKAPEKPTGTEKNGPRMETSSAGTDYTAYYRECISRRTDPAALSYLTARGISATMAARFGIGFDPAWISPTVCARLAAQGKDWRPDPTARVIIPVTKNHYIARAIDPKVTNYAKMNETGGGHIGLFNMAALYSGFDNVFICEGVFDALSIMEAGAPAVAINSTNNADQLIKELEGNPTTATLILAFDNDKAGNTATAKIREGAARLNISYVTANISAGFKDPNEALTGDREKFIDAIAKAQAQTAARPDNVSAYINLLMGDEIKAFKSDISTGFKNLDAKSGGLYPGLYAVGAISSLGKTTFCHQLADQIAAAGHDVLFFSMEQSRLEMVTKSIARIINQEDKTAAVSSLSIRKGYTPPQVLKAAAEYQKRVGERMNIIEGNFRCNIDFISDYTRRYMVKNNCKPVVFIDYLQILRPSAEQEAQSRPTNAKEVIDAAIVELKRMSREQGLTVIVISSVNRNNYMTPIDFESFKESGAIEYTCDVVYGLQLACINEPLFDEQGKIAVKRQRINQAKSATPREVELVCLKNRYGRAYFKCAFNYYCNLDLIEEAITDFNEDERPARRRSSRRGA